MKSRLIKKIIKNFLIVVLVLAALTLVQLIAALVGKLMGWLGAPKFLINIVMGAIYPVLTYLSIVILFKKVVKRPLQLFRIPRIRLKLVWCIAAILMPLLAAGIFILLKGSWEIKSVGSGAMLAAVSGAVVLLGVGSGIAEEMIFRGVIMGLLEEQFDRKVAVIVPSIVFALMHIPGRGLNLLGIIQLLIAGSMVGVLFSLVTLEGNSIWNSAMMHAVWNMVIVGSVFYIGTKGNAGIINYKLQSTSAMITGGAFGVEASVISIAVYGMFSLFALARIVSGHKGKKSYAE